MRTNNSTSGTTGKTRGASVPTTLAALALALPMTGLFGGTALAAATDASSSPSSASAANGNSAAAQAAAALKKDDAAKAATARAEAAQAPAAASSVKPAGFIGPVAPTASTASSTSPAANQNTTSVPFTNAGGVTTGSNTTKYEVVNGRSGSPAVGGGQPSGNVYSPQPFSKADQNNTGANTTSSTNPYRSTRDGAPSLNGNGGGKQVGQPCAGCVGKADNKNPPGQAPGGSDHNAGYECDRNHGIGRSNPAHTACTTPPTTTTPTLKVTVSCTGVDVVSTVKSLTSVTVTFVSGAPVTVTSGLGLTYAKDFPGRVIASASASNGSLTTTAPQTTTKCSTFTPEVDVKVACDTVSASANEALATITVTFKDGSSQVIPVTGKTYEGTFKNTVASATATTVSGKTGTALQSKSCNPGNVCVPTATQQADCTEKVEICHATGSDSNPFVVITPNKQGVVDGHLAHQNGDDVIPPFDYTDKNGDIQHFGGQNYTPGMVLSAENCVKPPKLCPGTTVPMPASGNVADCNPPKDCKNVVNGTATMADCTPGTLLCPNGSAMPASGNVKDCNPPVECADTAMVGPIAPGTMRPGCELAGGGGGPAAGAPGTTPVPTVIAQGSQPQPVMGTVAGPATAPAVVRARPTALPFTGGNAGLLAEGAALMLLLGGGLVFASRRKAVTV